MRMRMRIKDEFAIIIMSLEIYVLGFFFLKKRAKGRVRGRDGISKL